MLQVVPPDAQAVGIGRRVENDTRTIDRFHKWRQSAALGHRERILRILVREACFGNGYQAAADFLLIRDIDIVVDQEDVVVGRRSIAIVEVGWVDRSVRIRGDEDIALLIVCVHSEDIVDGQAFKREKFELEVRNSPVNRLCDVKIFDNAEWVHPGRLHRLQIAQLIPLRDIPDVVGNIEGVDWGPEDVTVRPLVGKRVVVVQANGEARPVAYRLIEAEAGTVTLKICIANNALIEGVRQ